MEKTINITLKVWRQKGPKEKGRFEEYKLNGVSTDSSFLEMLDLLNEQLINEGKEPVVFDHDCREGIRSISTDTPTGPTPALPLANCTCVNSTTET